jgi:hypothetical protein
VKIFKVCVEVEFYAVAEDEDSVHFDAEDHAREELVNGGADLVSTHEVTDVARVPKEWLDAIPYGGDEGDLTVRQILTAPEPGPEPERDTLTLDLFDEAAGGCPVHDASEERNG